MGRKKNRNKNKQPFPVQRPEEYDLRNSLKRLYQKREKDGSRTISDFKSDENAGQTINSDAVAFKQENTTGLFLQINDSINSRYDKLKDDISNVSDKIGISTDKLRVEMDKKLEGKVNSTLFYRLFYGAISVIVSMAIIIYIFSYSDLLKDSNQNKEKIDSIKLEQRNLNKDIKDVKKKLIDLREKQNVLEKMVNR